MAQATDVATYIRARLHGNVSRKKLLKLVYYAQAWHVSWDGLPLYDDVIEAWVQGPVVRHLWALDRHTTAGVQGDASKLTPAERASIEAVLEYYAPFDGEELSEFTHLEYPWRKARDGLAAHDASRNIISADMLAAYYGPRRGDGAGKRITDEYDAGLRALERMTPEQLADLDALGEGSDAAMSDENGATYLAWLEAGGTGPEPSWPESRN